MKILHIVPSYVPAHRYGGPIESVHSLNVGLVKAGVEVVVYTTNIDGPNDLNVPTGVPVIVDGVKVFYFKSSFPRAWFYSRDLHKALAKNVGQFDLIHITSVFLSVSALGAYYAKKFKKPYIISPRGSLMKSPLISENIFKKLKKRIYISLIENRNLKGASAVHFAVSEEEKEYKNLGFNPKKSIIIPNSFDFEKFDKKIPAGVLRKRLKISDNKKIVLFLSRLTWIKGLDTLIPAFVEVLKSKPNSVLILAGGDDEGYKKNVQLLITNYQLQNKVIFTGMLTGADKIAAFQDSDVFVLPSYSESFGMAVIEAMYFGLPVIITKNVGIAPSIEKAGAGIVIEKDENQLAEAILRILNNPDLAKKMGEAGKWLVETEFSLSKIAEKFLKEYNEILQEYEKQ